MSVRLAAGDHSVAQSVFPPPGNDVSSVTGNHEETQPMSILLSRRFRLVGLLVGLAVLVASGGAFAPRGAAPFSVVEAPHSAQTIRPTDPNAEQVVEQSGQIEAEQLTPLHARVSGYLKAWHVDIGDRVAEGQLLAELSVPELDRELLQKKAAALLANAEIALALRARDKAKANVEGAAATLRRAEAVIRKAESNRERWAAELARAQRLRQDHAIAAAEFDATQDQFRTVTAALAESKAAAELAEAERKGRLAEQAQAEASVQVAQAKERVAEADRDRLAEMVRFARITAPFAGVVTRRSIEKGQLVLPPPGGTPLFIVARTDRVRILVDVPESAAHQVHTGTRAVVRIQALGQREHHGDVTRTTWALDARTRALRALVELRNEQGQLRPGMLVSVRLNLKR
jgi:multidrug efflux pump subunit AcrA (membrane-fusion protein)